MTTLCHFAEDGDTSGFFPQLARWHDRSRYRMIFGTLKPMAPWLRDYMEGQGVACFSCECPTRRTAPLGILRMIGFLQRHDVEILHTHLFDPSLIGLTAGWLARTPLRVMTRHHSNYHTRINKRWHVRLDQLCTALCHLVIPVSEHTAQVMRDEEGAAGDKLRVVLNGVDFDRVRVSSPDAPAAIRRQYAARGEFLLLQVGRLHPEKGYEYLFPALKRVRDHVSRPVRLLVAGVGPFEQAYKDLVRDLGIDDMVTFLGFRRDVADFIAAADVLVLASVAEAFGLALAEALYLGTPIVATRAGGIPEIVTDGHDGLLVPPAEPEALAAAIISLVDDDRRRLQLAGAGREKTVATFAFESMVRQYEDVYEEGWSACRSFPAKARGPKRNRALHQPSEL
jgi:glycosyltransferase involved in cell wall biosynthesis